MEHSWNNMSLDYFLRQINKREKYKIIEGTSIIVTNQSRLFDLKKKQFITPYRSRKGYLQIYFSRRGWFTHRLIAQAFIPNPENKPFINHKNGIKDDNRIENLEWCTAQENNVHSFEVLGRKGYNKSHEKASKPILCTHLETGKQRAFFSRNRAAVFLGIKPHAIPAVISGKRSHAGGYTFEYLKPYVKKEKIKKVA